MDPTQLTPQTDDRDPPGLRLQSELDRRGHHLTTAAEMIGIEPRELLAVVNGETPVTDWMGARLAEVFGGAPDDWME